jgi:hypothetical protein
VGLVLSFSGIFTPKFIRSIPLVQTVASWSTAPSITVATASQCQIALVEVLAVPTSAPWLKISDVIDYVAAIKPKRSFATHNALLSDFGHALNNGRVAATTEAGGGTFTYLLVGDSIEI